MAVNHIASLVVIDAVIIGSGPNGLAAATYLAQQGASVLVVEGSDVIGGGTRTAELTLPGFHHDVCDQVSQNARNLDCRR